MEMAPSMTVDSNTEKPKYPSVALIGLRSLYVADASGYGPTR